MSVIWSNVLAISVLSLFVLALMPMLRRRSAALRHWVLVAGLICVALAPAVGVVAPTWRLPAWSSAPGRAAVTMSVTTVTAHVVGDSERVSDSSYDRDDVAADTIPSMGAAVRAVWITGTALVVLLLLVGLVRLALVSARARPITAGPWLERAAEIARQNGIRTPVLLECREPAWLVTWGLARPRVMLPTAATGWSDDRVRLVLAHELAHIRRCDWLVQVGAELIRAAYWFNPLIWMVCRRLRQESEHACDDAVLDGGVDGATYALHLVEIARALCVPRTWVPAPAIARRSSLERRVNAMLDRNVNRRPVSSLTGIVTLIALLALTVPVTSVVSAAQTTYASFSGSVTDPTRAVLPGVTISLTRAPRDANDSVRSDSRSTVTDGKGEFEFVGLPAGEYRLVATIAGFAKLQGVLEVASENVRQDLTLQIGSLQETITVTAGGVEAGRPAIVSVPRTAKLAPVCGSPTAAQTVRVGGNLRVPMKLTDVRPEYPASLRGSEVSGSVALHGQIGTDGTFDELNVVSSSHPDFADAALRAVRQWEFSPTYLNCVAVPVQLDVSVRFDSAR